MAHYGGSLFAALRDIFPDMINQKGIINLHERM